MSIFSTFRKKNLRISYLPAQTFPPTCLCSIPEGSAGTDAWRSCEHRHGIHDIRCPHTGAHHRRGEGADHPVHEGSGAARVAQGLQLAPHTDSPHGAPETQRGAAPDAAPHRPRCSRYCNEGHQGDPGGGSWGAMGIHHSDMLENMPLALHLYIPAFTCAFLNTSIHPLRHRILLLCVTTQLRTECN